MIRVAVVDDSDDIRLLVTLTLEFAGIKVVAQASTAGAALPTIAGAWAAGPVDAVILDERLPDGSGLDLAAELLRTHPGVSVVLFTAYADDDFLRRAERAGVPNVLSKEKVEELPSLIERLRRESI